MSSALVDFIIEFMLMQMNSNQNNKRCNCPNKVACPGTSKSKAKCCGNKDKQAKKKRHHKKNCMKKRKCEGKDSAKIIYVVKCEKERKDEVEEEAKYMVRQPSKSSISSHNRICSKCGQPLPNFKRNLLSSTFGDDSVALRSRDTSPGRNINHPAGGRVFTEHEEQFFQRDNASVSSIRTNELNYFKEKNFLQEFKRYLQETRGDFKPPMLHKRSALERAAVPPEVNRMDSHGIDEIDNEKACTVRFKCCECHRKAPHHDDVTTDANETYSRRSERGHCLVAHDKMQSSAVEQTSSTQENVYACYKIKPALTTTTEDGHFSSTEHDCDAEYDRPIIRSQIAVTSNVPTLTFSPRSPCEGRHTTFHEPIECTPLPVHHPVNPAFPRDDPIATFCTNEILPSQRYCMPSCIYSNPLPPAPVPMARVPVCKQRPPTKKCDEPIEQGQVEKNAETSEDGKERKGYGFFHNSMKASADSKAQ